MKPTEKRFAGQSDDPLAVAADVFEATELLIAPERLLLEHGAVRNHAVLVRDGRFEDVGPTQDVLDRNPELSPIVLPGKLLMPGFVDAHHHLTQSFGKALAFGEPSEIFRRVWVPLESALDERSVYIASKAAALEALRGGFTTVADAGTRAPGDTQAVARAVKEAGLRCVLGFICNDLGREQERDAIHGRAREHLARYGDDELVRPSLAISIPEAASDDMLREISNLCVREQAIFQTHVNEHLTSVERSLVDTGYRPLERLHEVGALGPQALVAHATLMTPAEILMLKETDTAVSYNPVASQWKGNAAAAAALMHELGIRFGLGTDGTRSDGFRLMDAAEATQRIAFGLAIGDSSCGGGWAWLEHATAGGAQAVGLGECVGVIRKGYLADMLLIDVDTPEFTPSWDLPWELVRFGNRDQIVAVFVGGRLRLWRGWPVDWDGRALVREVAAVAADAVARAPILRIHPTSGDHRAKTRDAGRQD